MRKHMRSAAAVLVSAALTAGSLMSSQPAAAAQETDLLTETETVVETELLTEAETATETELLTDAETASKTEEDGATETLPEAGAKIHGFVLQKTEHSSLLDADVLTFEHEVSGAQLLYVKNSDPEKAFSIAFHTPYVDETDTNHVFEHAILAASEKYPAKDIFFDMANKAYQTYLNAATGYNFTMYPLSSMSEEQLLKMMDVYMSCMEAPAILEDKRFFDREAVRFELNSPEEEIGINGTVYAEDVGSLTDVNDENIAQVLDALYPGETASNSIGRAHYAYKDLTWEHTLETYERFYHYDNCQIFLYGDLDYEKAMEFLDREYLSKHPAEGTDLSAWEDPVTPEGNVEETCEVPAYEGDTVEGNGMITYAIDLEGASQEELLQWNVLAGILNMVGSPLYNQQIERQISSPVSAWVMTDTAKPFAAFSMQYADEDQKEDLKQIAQAVLEEIAEGGVDPQLLDVMIKSLTLSSSLLRNASNVGVNLASEMVRGWASGWETNYYTALEHVLDELSEDESQEVFRSLAEKAVSPRRSALVASIPAPGLAEAYEEELAQYLKEKKAAMSEEEIAEMVEQTKAFQEWNAMEIPNNDYTISPHDLPDPINYASYQKQEKDGILVYQGTADVEEVGSYRVYFDLSSLSREEMQYLMLTQNYLTQLGTDQHDALELYLLTAEYVSGLSLDLCYPAEEAGENHRPMLRVSWDGLTGEFEKELQLVLELLTETDYHDPEMLTYLTQMNVDGWDMARQDGLDTATAICMSGAGLSRDTKALELDVGGQDTYYLMRDIAGTMADDESVLTSYMDALSNACEKAYCRDNLVFMSVTASDEASAVTDTAVRILKELPEQTGEDAGYMLPVPARRTAVCIEDSVNNSCITGDYMKDDSFLGRYLPFVYALNDKYTVPEFRFRLGAYSAGTYHGWVNGLLTTYVYSDPNVGSTIDALDAMPEKLSEIRLTPEELEGYILNAYSSVTTPAGVLNDVMNTMGMDLMGADYEKCLEIASDIRNADPALLQEAAEHISRVLNDSFLCTCGNEAKIRADADRFDEVLSYRE